MAAGAEYLQSIFGTEKDKVNCPFYFKIGACRHGDKCERRHNKPSLSQTLKIVSMWQNPQLVNPNLTEKQAQTAFDDFYEDIYEELSSYGEIEDLHICDNVCDHLLGNVYVKYFKEEPAEKALKSLTGRFYGGRPIVAEFSPVTDFRESSCRQYDMKECSRGGHCNFMHLKQASRDVQRRLGKKKRKSRSSSRSPRRHRSRSPSNKRRKDDKRDSKKDNRDDDRKKDEHPKRTVSDDLPYQPKEDSGSEKEYQELPSDKLKK